MEQTHPLQSGKILIQGYAADLFTELVAARVADILIAKIEHLKAQEDEKLLSPKETLSLFTPKITLQTLNNWTKKGVLKMYRIGGRTFYKKSEVLASVQTLKRYSINL